ncbi:MAG: histidine phosphatase family protein [Betaproteobacteria bacterium]|nr:histidine phosphatase family protein [Betaproteobacteria bacterium]
MELILWRHAEAVEATTGQPDLKRRLSSRGEKQARHIADWLRRQLPKHLRILVSPALRCQQTAQALNLPFDIEPGIGTAADVADLLALADWPDGDGQRGSAVLLVGHQPTLGRLAALLLSGQEADWTIKKGALWWFSNRARAGETQTLLRAVVGPEMI